MLKGAVGSLTFAHAGDSRGRSVSVIENLHYAVLRHRYLTNRDVYCVTDVLDDEAPRLACG
jgi:hypothetical protein